MSEDDFRFVCGGNGAVELPTEGDLDYSRPEGDVVDKRQFAYLFEENDGTKPATLAKDAEEPEPAP